MPHQKATSKSLKHLEQGDANWATWVMDNGLRCLHIPLPKDDRRFQVTLLVGTGSRHEPMEIAGISHLLEHMMFRGCAKYPSFSDLSEAFENLGGEWNAATGHEYTEFYYNGTTGRVNEAVELFADFILRPALSELDTERRIVLRELEGELNENGVSTDPDYHIATKIWPNTPMSMPIIGTNETLNHISMEQLKSWFKDWYTPDNAVLCAVGGSPEEIKKILNAHFGAWQGHCKGKKQKPIHSKFKGPHSFWVENSDNEYQIQMSFICEGTGSPKTAAYELLTRILADGFSSRLTRRIREELGLVYDISADLHQYDGMGLFNITASVLGENLKPFFAEVFGVFDKLTKEMVSPDELARHKHRALTDLEITTAEPAALAWRGSWGTLSGTDAKLSPWAKRYEVTTAEFLQQMAKEVFQSENLCVVALGPNEDNIGQEIVKMISKPLGRC